MAGQTAKSRQQEATPKRVALRRVSKGTRPQFHDHEAVDQLFAVVTALTGELSVAFDRIDALEQLLVAARALAAGSVEAYVPAAAAADARAGRREELIQRVFAVFETNGTKKTR